MTNKQTMVTAVDAGLTIEEYLAAEQRDGVRYEYDRGKIIAMPGGTYVHTIIGTNAARFLGNALDEVDADCIALDCDLKIELTHGQRYVYPDAAVVCGPAELSDTITGAVRNPTVVIEVLSASNTENELGRKKREYLNIPSLQEYMVVSQDAPVVEIIRRGNSANETLHHSYQGLDAVIEFSSIGCSLKLSDLYRKVVFESEQG